MKSNHSILTLLILFILLTSACAQAVPVPSATPPPLPDQATAAPPTSTAAPTSTTEPTSTTAPTATVTRPPATPLPAPAAYWWNEAPFYQIFVRSFFDSDGDGIGDFQGIIQKLDYLNDGDPNTTDDLGVGGIWLMPIFPSPSYHGYDVTDFYDVNPEYGTMEDFKQLLEEAHNRGIKVVIDMVLNHTSNQHPWFVESQNPDSPYRDWYIWSDTNPGYPGPWNQSVWHPGPNDTYYYGIFSPSMPDLNYTNPAVVEEMNKVNRFWLEEVGVDGFRLDGAKHVVEEEKIQENTASTHEFFQNFREFVKGINPQALILGEVWSKTGDVAPYLQGDELDLAFNFDLAGAYKASATNGDNRSVSGQLLQTLASLPANQHAPFLTNHDMDRIFSDLGGNIGKARTAAAMLLTGPGVPFIYYGEEVGMRGVRGSESGDEARRRPMQWSAEANAGFSTATPWTEVNAGFENSNVAMMDDDPDSLLNLYRGLSQLRVRTPALSKGNTYLVNSDKPTVYAVLRELDGQAVLVVINLSDKPVTDFSLSLPSGPLSGTYQPQALFGAGEFAELTTYTGGGFDDYQALPDLAPFGIYVAKFGNNP